MGVTSGVDVTSGVVAFDIIIFSPYIARQRSLSLIEGWVQYGLRGSLKTFMLLILLGMVMELLSNTMSVKDWSMAVLMA